MDFALPQRGTSQPPGSTCTTGGECDSGLCINGVCSLGEAPGGICDPLDPSAVCGPNQTCVPQPDGIADCLGTLGTGTQGSVCTDFGDCATTYACVSVGGGVKQCLQWCRSSADCSTGTCGIISPPVLVGTQEWGLCL